MCGINGIIYKNSSAKIKEVMQMNNCIKHRGPDDNGTMIFENIALGHVRLSIQDLSAKGKQPMSNDGRFWIIYNGEIYNFKELRDELSQLNNIFYSNTDTEVILNAYKKWGVRSFDKFNGMWSFAILDKEKKEIILSRDRYGVKPLYYHCSKDKIIFSSEIKGIYSSNAKIELDKDKLIYSDKILEGAFTTRYKDVDILPPGSFFKINLKNLEINRVRWWKGINSIPDINLNYSKAIEKTKELLYSATRIRLVSDVKISTSLSGGIDSSTIFAILNNIENNKIVDLNPFIFKDKNIAYEQAIDLARYYNKKPIIIEKTDYKPEDFFLKIAAIEIPSTYFNQLEIYKKQKENGFKVSIDGHGADECLGGYDKDIKNFSFDYLNAIADTYNALVSMSDNSVKNNGQLNKKPKYYNIDIKNLFYSDENYSKIINEYREYVDSNKINLISDNFIEDLKDLKNFNLGFQFLYHEANYGHMQWLLNKWDKASMASSVEIRSPFLDWKFFQYALSLPSEFKIRNGKNKSILRDSFNNILPNSINNEKRKQGLKHIKIDYSQSSFLNIMENFINEKNFTESKEWDGKKILKEFYECKKNNIGIGNKIWQIFSIYAMNKGFECLKNNSININEKNVIENFNYLKN